MQTAPNGADALTDAAAAQPAATPISEAAATARPTVERMWLTPTNTLLCDEHVEDSDLTALSRLAPLVRSFDTASGRWFAIESADRPLYDLRYFDSHRCAACGAAFPSAQQHPSGG